MASLAVPFKDARAQFLPFGGGLAVPTNDIFNNPKEYILDPLVHALIKVLLRTFTQGIISWIQTGGFQGSSLSIENFEEHFKRELDNQAGIFLEKVIGPEFVDLLCEPLRITIPRFALGLRSSFSERARCTITDIVENLENFEVQFSQGSWTAWDAMLRSNNNWMGLALMTLDEQHAELVRAFLSTKTEVDTTGGGLLAYKDCGTTSLGHIVNCVIKTPGKVVAKAAEEVFNTNLDQLEIADEINEIIAVALDQLISWAITGGGGGFGAGRTIGSGGGFDDELPDVSVDSPPDGATVSGIVQISASAFDNEDIRKVDFYVDGEKIAEDRFAPYQATWDTRSVSDGIHTIMVVAIDTSGNMSQDFTSVDVRNFFTPPPSFFPPPPPPAGPPPPPPPTPTNGSILIRRVDQNLLLLTSGTRANVDVTVEQSCSAVPTSVCDTNPALWDGYVDPSGHGAHATNLDGMTETVGTCEYSIGEAECTVGSHTLTPFCSGSDCNFGVTVTAGKVFKVEYKYTPAP